MTEQELIAGIQLAKEMAEYHETSRQRTIASYGTGVRPSWVSEDLAMSEYRRDQYLDDAKTLEAELETMYAHP
jgi:hypothetical protein